MTQTYPDEPFTITPDEYQNKYISWNIRNQNERQYHQFKAQIPTEVLQTTDLTPEDTVAPNIELNGQTFCLSLSPNNGGKQRKMYQKTQHSKKGFVSVLIPPQIAISSNIVDYETEITTTNDTVKILLKNPQSKMSQLTALDETTDVTVSKEDSKITIPQTILDKIDLTDTLYFCIKPVWNRVIFFIGSTQENMPAHAIRKKLSEKDLEENTLSLPKPITQLDSFPTTENIHLAHDTQRFFIKKQ